MNIGFFIVGAIIFATYMGLTIWNIIYSTRKQKEENYPDYYKRHGSPNRTEHKLPSGTKSRRGVERTVRVKNKKVHGKIQ